METISREIWDLAKSILPNEIIYEIGHWRDGLYRVMVDSEKGYDPNHISFDCYIIDIHNKVIALEGYYVIPHGAYLKIMDGGEGLISPRVTCSPAIKYEWEVIIPCDYSRIVDIFNAHGLVRVIKEGKWGVIDASNNIIIPIEYNHLSPIYPLENGQYKVIARKNAGESEFNLFIRKNYTVTTGDGNVPRLRGPVILSLKSQE